MSHEFIEHLKKDHDEQRELGNQLRDAKDPNTRDKLRQQFHEALYPHIVGEEASLFEFMTSAEGEAREGALFDQYEQAEKEPSPPDRG
jgi:hemerythrin superfamily protein